MFVFINICCFGLRRNNIGYSLHHVLVSELGCVKNRHKTAYKGFYWWRHAKAYTTSISHNIGLRLRKFHRNGYGNHPGLNGHCLDGCASE